MTDSLLKIENLSVLYATKQGWLSAVNDLSLAISRGEIVALVGESGCGKSTVAYALMGLLNDRDTVIQGEAWLEDKNILALDRKNMEKIRGKKIGLIFQNPLDSLNPVYRCGKQVSEAISLDERNKSSIRDRVLELFKEVRIPDPEKRILSFPHELSGGMRQRVMIAMMLSRNPDILIADEPTTALDVTIEAQILDIMCQLRNEHKTSILLITHNFGIVAKIADKIGVMYSGELIEYGDVLSVFDNPVHPYTAALMRSLPRISKEEGRLEAIDGIVPRIMSGFSGCRFQNRCPYSEKICLTKKPPLFMLNNGHFYRCHMEFNNDKN